MSHRLFCEQFIAALRAGDWAAMESMLHPDFEVVEADGLPYAGTYRGTVGWRQLSDAILATWSRFSIAPMEIHDAGRDAAVIRFAVAGKSRRTGRSWQSTILELWRFRDGLLARIDPYYFDTHLLARADAE